MTGPLTPAKYRSWLISLLRDRSRWPEGFEWNFDSASACAIGLMSRVVLGSENDMSIFDWRMQMQNMLGLSTKEFTSVFCTYQRSDTFVSTTNRNYPVPNSQVTPEMVSYKLWEVHHDKQQSEID